jgi:hypothetical protein
MLYPQQARTDWINTPAQVASIIRLSEFVIHPDDEADRTIFEEFAFGNPDNFYVFHSPTGFPGFPSFAGPIGPPGAGPSVTGAPAGTAIDAGLVSIADQSVVPIQTYTGGDPDVSSGDSTSGKVLAYTQERFPVNAPLFFRWSHPNPKIGHQTRYCLFLGQLAFDIVGNTVVIWRDTSAGGDRSSFERIWSRPMFGPSDFTPDTSRSFYGPSFLQESEAHDRSLLIIPYFRNRVLVMASNGTAYSVAVKGEPKAAPGAVLSGPVTDRFTWEITREDTVMVWCVTPAPGRFQCQRPYFAEGQAQIDLPPITIDYTPADPPTVTLAADRDHDTNVTGTVSDPPGYTFPVNDLARCPAPFTATTAQSSDFGVRLTLVGESTHRWTPFFYGIQFSAPTVFKNNPASPVSVTDTGAATTVAGGFLSWGDKPGDGRLECNIIDKSPYAFSTLYYRTGVPVRLAEGLTSLFVGWTDPMDVQPLHEVSRPRLVHLMAVDRWKQLAETYLRDNRDWTGVGHISVVLSIAQQAGIDTTNAETPPLTNVYNTPLGGIDTSQPQTEKDARLLNSGWKPQDGDTAETFLLRIAERFSGWDIGFRPSGELYYLPKDYFTALAVRFFHSAAARTAAGVGFENNPLVRPPVEFNTIEPEGNVVFAVGGSEKDGTVMLSALHVDWASINNPLAQNYMGRRKYVVVEMPGVYTCQELNRIARAVFQQARRRRRMISFESEFVPTLKIGERIEVGTYGTYRLKGVKVDLERSNWHDATYFAELDELGYNV